MRLSSAEREMLDWLAERDGLSASDVLRQLVRREYVTREGPPAKRPRSTRKAR